MPVRLLSVDPADPDHLGRWLRGRGVAAGPTGHIPRRLYGDYLSDVLAARCRGAGPFSVDVVTASVGSLESIGHRFLLVLDDGRILDAGAVVLATGVAPAPAPVPVAPDLDGDPRVTVDPWAPGALDRLAASGARRIVAVGTGLTTVDLALSLTTDAGVRIDAVSRHGLLPHSHPNARVAAETGPVLPDGPLTAADVRRAIVEHARTEPQGWEAAIDRIKERSADIWTRMSVAEQAKLMGRTGAVWNVHRHRMAPPIAAALESVIARGQLVVHRARVAGVERDGSGLRVRLTGRHAGVDALPADALVLCTGPITDIARTTDPLVRHLLRSGLAAVGPHRMGLHLAPDGTVLDATGQRVPGLVTVGALRRGSEAETTAIPELRAQAAALAGPLVARVSRPVDGSAGRHPLGADAVAGVRS